MFGAQQSLFKDDLRSIEEELTSLIDLNEDIRDVTISYFDGTPIISTDDSNEISYILAAAASALKGIADKISRMLQSGLFVKIIIQFENEKIIVLSIDNKVNILLRASINAPLGLLLRDLSRLANKIRSIIK